MEIASKRHPYKFYLLLIIINLFFLGIGSIFISASIRDNNDTGFFIFLVFLVLIIYYDYKFIKNSSKIILNNKGILYKNEFYNWNDISNIKLTGKSGLIFNIPTECATLTFNNLSSIRIFDDLYSNSAEIKYFIQEVVINKKEERDISSQKNTINDLKNESFIIYKGNPIFSFRGLFMWLFILAFILIPFISNKPINFDKYKYILIVPLFWFILNSWMMFYFEISKNYFVVKNHYFFWKNDIYKISEINEIVFEQLHKQPNSLKIINNKFRTKLYSAGSLTDKTWLAMKTDLENKNIIIRNECISENK